MTSTESIHSHQNNKKALTYEFIAICALLFLLGFNFSTWASRIPAIRDSALLIPATLGYALLARGVGSVLMVPVTAWLVNRIGARTTAYAFGWIVAFSLLPIAYSPNWLFLAFSMIIMGGSGGGFNLAINAIAAGYEKRIGQSKMSSIHSWFGVGNLSGAVLGTGAAALMISAQLHIIGITIIMSLVVITAFKFIPEEKETIQSAGFEWPEKSILWLGIIIFFAAWTEASVMNWIALFYSDYIGTGERIAAVGYTTYALSLLLMRFFGDRLRFNIGANKLITVGSFIAAVGIIIAILSQHIVISSLGIFLLGAGVALTFPFIFSVAGKISPNALATVIIFGGIGELVSQPIMGVIVQNIELDGGFYVLAAIVALTCVLSWNATLLRET